MKKILFLFIFIGVCSVCIGQKKPDYSKADSIDGVYIPKDIDDCFVQLDSFWSDSIKNEVRDQNEEDFTASVHLGIGRWIRNNWGLWGKGSRLSKYFNNKGIYHPDDISAIILTSYHRYLTGNSIDLEEQINYYIDYWKIVAEPNKKDYPKGVKEIVQMMRFIYKNTEEEGCLHVYKDAKSEELWLYDYYYGWKKINNSILNEIESEAPLSNDLVREFFEK